MAAFTNMFESDNLRNEGNDSYRLALDEGAGFSLKKIRFQKAIRLYERAAQAAINEDQLCSALKNIGATHLMIVKLHMNRKDKIDNEVFLSSGISVKALCDALVHGAAANKEQKWFEKTREMLSEAVLIVDALIQSVGEEDISTLIKFKQSVASVGASKNTNSLRSSQAKQSTATFFLNSVHGDIVAKIGKNIFNAGLVLLNKSDWQGCRSKVCDATQFLKESVYCYKLCASFQQPIQEIIVTNLQGEFQGKIYELEDYIERSHITECMCDSVNLREEADRMFTWYLGDEMELNMDMIFTVADMYKQAAIVTREHDIENEAIALSRLARLNDKVLKSNHRAKRYSSHALDLAESMQPKDVSNETWYKECVEINKKFYSDEQKAQRREEILKELETELSAINEICRSHLPDVHKLKKLLRHIYEKHPPKNEQKIGKLEPASLRATLMKAILHYSPDKQVKYQDEVWTILCTEIAKQLNELYTKIYKGDFANTQAEEDDSEETDSEEEQESTEEVEEEEEDNEVEGEEEAKDGNNGGAQDDDETVMY